MRRSACSRRHETGSDRHHQRRALWRVRRTRSTVQNGRRRRGGRRRGRARWRVFRDPARPAGGGRRSEPVGERGPQPQPESGGAIGRADPSGVTDPAGVWIATGSMGTPRYDHAAVRLLDGRVLVVGGSSRAILRVDLTSAELYDPGKGTWSATGNMVKPHIGLAATLLRDGRVLVGDIDDRKDDGGEPAPRCTTRRAGPGPPRRRWSWAIARRPRCCATARCSCRWRRRLRAVRPRQRDLDRDTVEEPHSATATRPSCCPTAGCSWQAATSTATPRQTRPSCTTRTRDRGQRSQACTPSARSSRRSCSPMAGCSWWAGPIGATLSRPSCTTRRPGPGPPSGTVSAGGAW